MVARWFTNNKIPQAFKRWGCWRTVALKAAKGQASEGQAPKGQAMVELCGSVIIFAIMAALMTSLSIMLYMQHVVITAAREGARTGAVNTAFANNNEQAGINAVNSKVTEVIQQMAGQSLTSENSEIEVMAPDDSEPYGERTVRVTVTYNMTNPIPIGSFIEGMSGGDHSGLKSIPITASASMRYEE